MLGSGSGPGRHSHWVALALTVHIINGGTDTRLERLAHRIGGTTDEAVVH